MLATSVALLATCLALPELVKAGFNLNSQSNIAVYYGQNSYGQASSQQRLSVYCSNSKLSVIPLAFMNGISTPIVNFANAGANCTVYSGTQLLDCPQLEEDIQICQNTYSKTVILSLGGATYSEGGFSSSTAAQNAATTIWGLLGPDTSNANRPFRTAVIDGFDFDFEATTKNTAPFAQKLRNLMDAATAAGGKKYYLTAAPQCPYPDVAQNDILSNVALDFVMVQFYNNYCGVSSFVQDATTQNNFNMERWDLWAKQTSKNVNVRVLLGVPANTGAGGGYLSADPLAPVIRYCKQFSSFGGVMMWDMSQMVANVGFLDGVFAALTEPNLTSSQTTATSTTTRTTTATMTTTSRLGSSSGTTLSQSATVSESPAICNCPLQTVVTVTATVYMTSSAAAQISSNTVGTSSTPTTTTSQSVPMSTTITSQSQASESGTVVTLNQWQQCGGRDYTGPTQCKAPYTCVIINEWWSDCR